MTVKELIARLQMLPPQMEVVIESYKDPLMGPLFNPVKDAEQNYLLDAGESFVLVDPECLEGIHCVVLTDY
jgi:hypothetical protein